ncbi:unnamed protein product [Orchesella dallaii]|uniref:DnaJ homolog subfamily C member 2 n=1 Tax=Orchesella dallaii TaxID=48710 RepID=A0ABP1RD00_9HEXA
MDQLTNGLSAAAAARNTCNREDPYFDSPYSLTLDRSLIIVRKEDIFFSPLTPSGKPVLKRFKTLQKRRAAQWTSYLESPQQMDSEHDIAFLRNLDPVKWKDQDHYRVIGLKHLRHKATEDDIKKAYRIRVLKHHPDKRQAAGEYVNTDEGDYFSCIVKAYEILSSPLKRRAYDSIDPFFDKYTPPKSVSSPEEFFSTYGKWFSLNSRWSSKQPSHLLGNTFTTQRQVDRFYEFWFDFDSWREYSYLDEEDKETGQCKEERRWIDKQNKAQRAQMKKEEMARIRSVVEQAFRLDPRVIFFKELGRREKLERKLAKQKAFQAEKEQLEKVKEEEERVAREEDERRQAEEREKEAAARKIKEGQKRALKKERKTFRTLCKSNNYYGIEEDEKGTVENMGKMEHLCEILEVDELTKLNESLEKMGIDEGRREFEKVVKTVEERIAEEKARTACQKRFDDKQGGGDGGTGSKGKSGSIEWSHEELQVLIKAVNLFPAGTAQRWQVVANFINQHDQQGKERSAKEVLAKAKDLNSSDFSKNRLKEEANQKAFELFEKSQKTPMKVGVEPETVIKTKSSEKAWTTGEQKLLEQALKTYSASANPSDRWERVAEAVPGRSKKECMARFKELAALVKAKKSAAQIQS